MSAEQTNTEGTGQEQARPRKASSERAGSGRAGSKPTSRERTNTKGTSPGQRPRRTMSVRDLAASAARQMVELTGRQPEGVTGVARSEDGWTVQVEVVEARRIPDSADMMALYDVEVDAEGELLGYRRIRRYPRGRAGEE